MFGRGDLKYALLELLQERPKHGYEMIKELENRAGGFYTPSAGAIYPTLQLLEDRDWVRSATQEGKKVYTITDAGRQELAEHQARRQAEAERQRQGGPGGWGDWGGWGGHGHHHGRFSPTPEVRQEMRAMALEGREVARLMRAAVLVSAGNPERIAQLRGIVAHARSELESFLGQQPSGSQPGAAQQGQGAHGQQTSGPTGPVEQV
jgi:DNA-binding PadR family transcriptional regulator